MGEQNQEQSKYTKLDYTLKTAQESDFVRISSGSIE